jgi:hypothetical protein
MTPTAPSCATRWRFSGVERCLFASNFPVAGCASGMTLWCAPWRGWWRICRAAREALVLAQRGAVLPLGRRGLTDGEALKDEFLHPVALGFPGDDIALGIDAQTVDMKELAGLAPRSADVTDLLE